MMSVDVTLDGRYPRDDIEHVDLGARKQFAG
jgi:hypothetical protein